MDSARGPYRGLPGMFARFLVSGGFNTAVTYALYCLLLLFWPYRMSYTIAFVSGIILSYFLNRVFVFRARSGIGTFALFPLIYLFQYLAGLAVVSIWVEMLAWSTLTAPFAAIALTVPLTFVLSHRLFTNGKEDPDENCTR